MNNDLEHKSKVVVDLLDRGVDYINITNTSLIVWRHPVYDIRGNPIGNTQIVNVHAKALASTSVNYATQLSILHEELKEIYKNDKRLNEIEEKIREIEIELKKKSPDKINLKKLLSWILDFDWEIYLRIIPIILEKFS
jgi:hypothetical protein